MRRFTFTAPQGIGDCWWLWNKAAPLADELVFRVIDLGNTSKTIVRRAEKTIMCLPKMAGVEYVKVRDYPRWLSTQTTLASQLYELEGGLEVGWCPNPWLEAGVPLERIDPGLPVEWDPKVPPRPVHGLTPGRYLALYVSGDAARHATLGEVTWSPAQWAHFAERVCYHRGLGTSLPILQVGAAYDLPVLNMVGDTLRGRGFQVLQETDLELPELLWLFGNAWGFLGYQSGLNVICAAAGGRQFINYYDRILRMEDKWAHPSQRGTGRFVWGHFRLDPETLARMIPWPAP